jgi:hypothetical protein
MRIAPFALLAVPLVAGIATAQPPAPGGGDWQAAMAQRRQEMQADIATVLALRPDQQPALQTWLGSMGPAAGGGGPEARQAALGQFRATLDARQQTVFDALERLRHGRAGGGGGRGWRGGAGRDTPPPPPGA